MCSALFSCVGNGMRGHTGNKVIQLFLLRQVPAFGHDGEGRSGDQLLHRRAVGGWEDLV